MDQLSLGLFEVLIRSFQVGEDIFNFRKVMGDPDVGEDIPLAVLERGDARPVIPPTLILMLNPVLDAALFCACLFEFIKMGETNLEVIGMNVFREEPPQHLISAESHDLFHIR